MIDLNSKRKDTEAIDSVFGKIYGSLAILHAEAKARNAPNLAELKESDEILGRAEEDKRRIKKQVKDKYSDE